MKSNQKKYLDKVVGLIVSRIRSPFQSTLPFSSLHFSPHFLLSLNLFSMYCEDTYGLTENEIEYVWDQYTIIMKDKIRNNER
jgi:hypothetical protein